MKSLPDSIVVIGAGGHAKVVIAKNRTVREVRWRGCSRSGYDDDQSAGELQQILGVDPVKVLRHFSCFFEP